MTKCVFCGKDQDDFRGTYLLKNDGSIDYFCSSKCRKNQLKLKRDRRKMKWTEAFHITKDKRLSKERERITKSRTKKEAERIARKAGVKKSK